MVWNNWCTFHLEKKYIGFITHFSSWSVSGYSRTGDKLRDHDIVAGTVKVVISPIKNLGEMSVYIWKVIMNQGEKMHLNLQRKSISTVVQILARYKWTLTWLLLLFKIRWINTSPSKTSRTVSSVPWITSEIRRTIHRKNKTNAKAKKTDSKKLRSKFETLRREIKDEVRKQHDFM